VLVRELKLGALIESDQVVVLDWIIRKSLSGETFALRSELKESSHAKGTSVEPVQQETMLVCSRNGEVGAA
jgi:hypothetical protein